MFKVGDIVRVGGCFGPLMKINSISGDDMVLIGLYDNCHSIFYFHKGDCLIWHEKLFEQLTLF